MPILLTASNGAPTLQVLRGTAQSITFFRPGPSQKAVIYSMASANINLGNTNSNLPFSLFEPSTRLLLSNYLAANELSSSAHRTNSYSSDLFSSFTSGISDSSGLSARYGGF